MTLTLKVADTGVGIPKEQLANIFERFYQIKGTKAETTGTGISFGGGYTVAEISYMVGFSSPSYFTKCYKDHFGHTPKEGK